MGVVKSAQAISSSALIECAPSQQSLRPSSSSSSAPPSPWLPLESALAPAHLSEECQTLMYLRIWASGTNTQTCLRSIRMFLQLEQSVYEQHTRRKAILLG